jgi:WD40 repeat protein
VDDYAAVHLLFHEDAVSGLAASQTEPRVLLSCSWDEQVALWDVEAPRAPLASWAPPGLGRLHGVAWLAGAKAFLVGAQVDAACVFDSSLGAARPQLTLATTTAVTCVATAPGVAHLVACGTSVGDTLLFDLRSVREPLARVAPAEYGAVNELAFHATLPLLLVASDDGRVRALHVAPHSQPQAAAAAPRAALLHARPAASKAVCWGAERLLALSAGWDGQLATHRVTESDAL